MYLAEKTDFSTSKTNKQQTCNKSRQIEKVGLPKYEITPLRIENFRGFNLILLKNPPMTLQVLIQRTFMNSIIKILSQNNVERGTSISLRFSIPRQV